MPARVYTVAPGVPFADALAGHLLARLGGDPLALADAVVLLPTRRAARALAEAFLRASGGRPLLLPRLAPLGDLDADEIGLIAEPDGALAPAEDVPPAISELYRRVQLARLILARDRAEGGDMTPAQAAGLAGELARLIDRVETEGLGFDGLESLVDADYAAHWGITLAFLRIVTEQWPKRLEELGCIDPADRRVRLIAAQDAAWRRDPPATPVIAAGSTGSVPATAALMRTILSLPDGAVVLPGFDRTMDAETRALLGETHPQFGMMQLLDRLGVDPADLRDLPDAPPSACPAARRDLLRVALRPADDAPAPAEIDAEATLAGVARIEAPSAREEAAAIALTLRGALETPGRTAALITPDRGLARRVAAELRRWDVEIDDSAGRPLSLTPPGGFLRLTAEMVAEAAAPAPLLAALKHPLACGGEAPGIFRARVRAIERAALRGPRPTPGFDGLARALAHQNAAGDLVEFADRLVALTAPLAALTARAAAPAEAMVRAHVALAETLAASDALPGPERLWAGEAGEAAALFVDALAESAGEIGHIKGDAYPGLLDALMREQIVRPRYGRHPRLHIWGPLEARLQQADLVVLGGLNEGVWPPEPEVTPWMSRAMMRRFGLPSPERRIGQAAHDFVQAASAGEIVITRARREEGAPTVASRFLALIDNVTSRPDEDGGAREASSWLGWVEALDAPDRPSPSPRPEPRPPVAARPQRLSVTQVETWMRDPYAIYARHILGLRALEPIDADPSAAERGSLVHDALDAFLRDHPEGLPEDALARLIEAGERVFAAAMDRPGVAGFWWPRFLRAAAWFVDWQLARQNEIARSFTETTGELVVPGPAGPLKLTAKADRIDVLRAGGLTIIDYKTGSLPAQGDVDRGLSPQLALEALIAESGGFAGLPLEHAPRTLTYLQLGGGREPGQVRDSRKDAATLAAEAYDGLARLIAAFAEQQTPYLSCPDPSKAPRYSDYEHLARVKEWSIRDSDATS